MENSTITPRLKEELPRIARQYSGFNLSVIPVRNDKRPALARWGLFQKTRMDNGNLTEAFSNPDAAGIAIICGPVSGNLEVIDVDCKYDETGRLWDDYSALLSQSLPLLFPQLVIAATINNGYHLYYRCAAVGGNQKLANRSDGRVLIETRGEGGYVVAAPSPGYRLIQGEIGAIPFITPEERETLLSTARSFDETPVRQTAKPQKEELHGGLSPFDDYNSRGDVVALLESHGWRVVRHDGDQVSLLRPGKDGRSTSATFHRSLRIFYPFTSSTIFDARKGYNPTQVYTILECDGDYSAASRKLYREGYGERRASRQNLPNRQKLNDPGEPDQPDAPLLPFPVDAFPQFLQDFITLGSAAYCSPADFWAGAVLIATALAIGDKMELADKYDNVPVLWLVIVGDVSSGKSFPLQFCLRYFKDLDSQSIREYGERMNEYERITKLTMKERQGEGITVKPQKPECFQYILNDYTPEAMVAAHRINSRGMLIERDELKGWIDDFNRYNKSGEQSNMLSSWSRVGITYNRKLSGIMSIPRPTILVGGGMQPDLLSTLAADKRAENGFLSRLCIIFPDNAGKGHYSDQLLSPEIYRNWETFLSRLTKLRKPQKLILSEEALAAYSDWYNYNADETNRQPIGYLKGVYGKLDIIALRLAIVIHGMNYACQQTTDNSVSFKEMKSALRLSEYFRATALKTYHTIFEKTGPAVPEDQRPAYTRSGHR